MAIASGGDAAAGYSWRCPFAINLGPVTYCPKIRCLIVAQEVNALTTSTATTVAATTTAATTTAAAAAEAAAAAAEGGGEKKTPPTTT